jgi:hypothetical protein
MIHSTSTKCFCEHRYLSIRGPLFTVRILLEWINFECKSAHWTSRLFGENHRALTQVSDHADWETRRDQTVGVTAAIYLGIPDEAPLWVQGNDTFEPFDRLRAREAFNSL